LQFSYTAGAATQLAIVGISRSGEILPYFPLQLGTAPIDGSGKDVALLYSTPLGGTHPGGAIDVVAIHAKRSLDAAEVEAIARGRGNADGVVRVQKMELDVGP
jgi:hypothetical protein